VAQHGPHPPEARRGGSALRGLDPA
jgi:hypothetical protein